MTSLLHSWFGWPNGSVLTNLVASLFWGGAGFMLGRHLARRHFGRLHERLDALHARVDDLHAKHDAVFAPPSR